jgi:hypothetical protein
MPNFLTVDWVDRNDAVYPTVLKTVVSQCEEASFGQGH